MLSFSVPPGYRRRERPASKKLGPYMASMTPFLKATAAFTRSNGTRRRRIFGRLRDEQGFTGGYTIVREYARRRCYGHGRCSCR